MIDAIKPCVGKMYNDREEGTLRFPEFVRGDFNEIQLREIPPTPIESSFDVERIPRARANSAVSDVSELSTVSVTTDAEYLVTEGSPSRNVSKARGRSHSNESRYSIFPVEAPRRKSTASTKTTRITRERATSIASSEWSTTLDVPTHSKIGASRASRASRSSSSPGPPSRLPSRSRGYSNPEYNRTISLEVPARTGTISSRPRGVSHSDSMASARTSISRDFGDHRSLLNTGHPPPAVSENDLMAQFENYVDAINGVPARRITPRRVIAPTKKKTRWMQLDFSFQNPSRKKPNILEEETEAPDGVGAQHWKNRSSVLSALMGSVLVVYIVFVIWASQRSGNGTNIGSIYDGSCSMVNATNFGLHILINVMGMVVSMASACALYFLSSPTRNEIDEAHAKGNSLDIGVLSLGNLKSLKKKILFGLLLISSIPIHLFSNSMVFASNLEVDYDVVIVSPHFLVQSTVDCSQDVAATCSEIDNHPISCETHPLNFTTSKDSSDLCNTSIVLHESATQNKLRRLNTTDCLTAYSTLSNPSSNYGNVLVVTKNQPLFTNNTILLAFHHMTYSSVLSGHGWTCGPEDPLPGHSMCDISNLILNADIWTLGPSQLPITSNSTSLESYERWEIDHCLAETLPDQPMCKLQYSRLILLCIIIASAVKFICILFIAASMNQTVLSTVKDAVTSFQGRTDAVTSNRNFIHRNSAWKSKDGLLILEPEVEGRPRNLRWFHGASLPLWIATLFLGSILLAIPLILLTIATVPIPNPYSISLGSYSPLAIINIFPWSSKSFVPFTQITNTQLFRTVLLANLPQFAVSILLFLFAQVYTRMLSANTFSCLTNPSPSLKSRKIMGFSCAYLYISAQALLASILHFLVSQALFIHHVEVVGSHGSRESLEYLDLGYNPLGILVSLVFGGVMVGTLIATGSWRLSGGQLVGSGSMEIAAACKDR
ncbi:86264bf5-c589-40d8-a074-f67d65727c7b [Sclerotinia trifoliorum]|uniref:86264bf5-c589-40d8-a074-f67d65727c7b n=1 Tax=Sclerotinia trifoliorum TaxID=28548 RepID=A0A8H2W0U0_9HELO|nr:86264bf5-c589-40d8-a074-f67d65727c7b [Sclerotinia trifoliorum]